MRAIFITVLFIVSVATANAQQDYEALLNTFYQHSEGSFKDISGPENNSTSFVDCTIKPDIGTIKIMKTSFAVTLNWEIPLAQSAKVRTAVQEFMNATYADKAKYKTASDGTEAEGEIWTNVYELKGNEKPLVIFKTIYYKSPIDPKKSSFSVVMYGK